MQDLFLVYQENGTTIGSGLEPSWMKAPNLTVLPMISVVLSAAVAIDVVASSMTAKINVSRDSNFFMESSFLAYCPAYPRYTCSIGNCRAGK